MFAAEKVTSACRKLLDSLEIVRLTQRDKNTDWLKK